jgi:hypothetical protein
MVFILNNMFNSLKKLYYQFLSRKVDISELAQYKDIPVDLTLAEVELYATKVIKMLPSNRDSIIFGKRYLLWQYSNQMDYTGYYISHDIVDIIYLRHTQAFFTDHVNVYPEGVSIKEVYRLLKLLEQEIINLKPKKYVTRKT